MIIGLKDNGIIINLLEFNQILYKTLLVFI